MKLARSIKKTRRRLELNLRDFRKPFYSTDLFMLCRIFQEIGSPCIMYSEKNKAVEFHIENNSIDLFCFRIKYSIPDMDIAIKIKVSAGAPQVMSLESDTIELFIESFMNNSSMKRKIIVRHYSFINAISFENLESSCKTPTLENNLNVVKKVLADSFGVVLDHINWKGISWIKIL